MLFLRSEAINYLCKKTYVRRFRKLRVDGEQVVPVRESYKGVSIGKVHVWGVSRADQIIKTISGHNILPCETPDFMRLN